MLQLQRSLRVQGCQALVDYTIAEAIWAIGDERAIYLHAAHLESLHA